MKRKASDIRALGISASDDVQTQILFDRMVRFGWIDNAGREQSWKRWVKPAQS